MKRLIAAAVALTAALTATLALAGESRFLGTIYSRGASASNRTTQVTLSDGGLSENAFWIPFGAKLTAYCDGDGRMLTDSLTVSRDGGSNRGIPVAGLTLFPTSVSAPLATTDASIPTSVISIISNADDAGIGCEFWQRSGTE
jgi:hypothetical protein